MSTPMTTPWLTDLEVDDITAGLRTNAAKTRHLEGLGLFVSRKPNGRPLVMRAHAETVLSGLAKIEPAQAAKAPPATNRGALVQMFRRKQTA